MFEDIRQAHASDVIVSLWMMYNLLVLTLLLSFFTKFCQESRRGYQAMPQSNSPFAKAGFFSRLLFLWVYPMLRLGWQRPLEAEDTYELRMEEEAKYQSKLLQKYMKNNPAAGIFGAVLRIYYSDVFVVFWLALTNGIIDMSCALFILLIEEFLTDPSTPYWKGVAILWYLAVVKLVAAFVKSQMKFRISLINSHLKSSVSCILHRKCMRISSATIAQGENAENANFTFAQTINLMQIDLERISWGITYSLQGLVFPFQIVFYIVMLFLLFNTSGSVAAIIALGVIFALNFLVSYFMEKVQGSVFAKKDKRVKMTNELLNNIRVLKLYNWETKIADRVRDARRDEMKSTKTLMYIFMIIVVINWSVNAIMCIAAVDAMALSGGTFTPAILFTGFYVIEGLSQVLRWLPNMLNNLIQCRVSMRRMDKYLLCQEVEHYITESSSQDEAIQIQNASFNWEFRAPGEATETIILKEINLSVKKGEFIAVIGSVGSGKSSLLNALIENMKYIPLEVDSKVAVKGSIAYANQVAWVLNATIRDNILFGMTYDEEKYNRVLQICELENDLAILPGGDLTEIGEKGINLSGGQKARVSLARVIYSDADIMLLDDPMAAVDSHVGLSIFQKCLLDHCMFKTRILVTHGQHFLSKVDRVLFMNQGRIVDFGTFNELLSRCKQFNEYFTLELQKQESADAPPEPPPEELEQEDVEAKKAAEGRKQVNIIETEDRNTGRVSFDIYKIYFKYFGGPGPVIIALISMLLWQACEAAAGLYVTGWSEDSESNQLSNMHTYVLVYSLLQASSSLTIILRVCVIYNAGLRAAIIIFDKALDSLINAPINKFYDITPSGRIINRLSKDQDKADTQILFTIGNFIGMFFLAAFCVLISVIVDPYILLVVPIVVYLMYRIQNQYLTSARELTRLESVSRSPIIEHFSETITGSSTIRAFGHSKRFYERMKNVLDTNIRQFLSLEGTNTWLSLYLEFSGNIILIVSISVIILARGYISPGMAGLTFTWMIFLPEIIYSVILAQANIENQMVCVERLDALVKVHPESLRSRVKDNLLPDWPSEGQIEFKDYQMKYRDNTEIVLKGININIKPREKVGIVGRTGSGKSSIGMGLFRIVEALAGQIYIDGVNIAEIGLDLLRQRLSLIPQDPALFQGTMRENLDPFGTHSESELSTALSSIGLSLSLDKDITENGDNLSAGERQLVCIARAILRKSKVMLLDEATASIDLVLDEKIQEVIRKMFKDCTVLTIAHRINTIMDYDRIIVMDDGLVVEFDTPQALLDQKGVFWRLNEKFKSKQ